MIPQKNPFAAYLEEIAKNQVASADVGTRDLEHQHRPALKRLLETLMPDVTALNEPGKNEFGMPDFALIKNRWPVGYVETKRVGANLDEVAGGEQMKRYFGYANLVLTNYVEFRFYKHGERYGEPIAIADATTLTPDQAACELLRSTFAAFLEEAAKLQLPSEPATGESLQKITKEVLATSPEAVKYARDLMGSQ